MWGDNTWHNITWPDVMSREGAATLLLPSLRRHSAVYWVKFSCLYSEQHLLVDLQIKLLSFSLFHVFLLIQRLCLTWNFPVIAASLIQLLELGSNETFRFGPSPTAQQLSRREMLLLVVSVSFLSPVLAEKNWWVLFKVRKINHYDLHTVASDSTMSVSAGQREERCWCWPTDKSPLLSPARGRWLTLVEREWEKGRSIPKISAANLTCELGY